MQFIKERKDTGKKILLLRWLFLSAFLPVMLFAKIDTHISDTQIANAQTILVTLQADQNEPGIQSIYVAFEGIRYPFYKNTIKHGRNFYALIPVSYYTKPKRSRLVVVHIERDQKFYHSFLIDIVAGVYQSEKLKVAKSKAQFSQKDKRRIAAENKEAMKIYRTNTPQLYIKSPFAMPMQSKITSAFGTKRVFNGVLKSYHSGTDFRAHTGTPVKATNDGKVVLAKNRFFAGNSVIIDHGEGIYTGYYHLSRFKVKVGQWVRKGEVIGLSGMSGRVTGPHLHFSARINGIQVDPMQCIKTCNRLFKP